jgi:peptide/nickel transport system substrate-binding protein
MVRNDARTGEVTGREAGTRIALVRNPNWDRATDYRPAFLDAITIEEGNSDTTLAARRTLRGRGLMCCGTPQLPASIVREAITRFDDQLGRVPAGGTTFVGLNTRVPPLDNLNVRKAIVAGVDRRALRDALGGAAVGAVAQGFIPPGLPGYEESGGMAGFRDLDFIEHPEGDPPLARRYMLAAGEDGVPVTADGHYAGGEELLMVGANAEPGVKVGQIVKQELEDLGFHLRLRVVAEDTMATRFCGVPEARVAVCPNLGWYRDFSDAESMLLPLFNGDTIIAAGNVNMSQLDVPEINAAMARASRAPAGRARTAAWAQINHDVMAQAPVIPILWSESVQAASADVRGVMNGYTTMWDLTFSSVR